MKIDHPPIMPLKRRRTEQIAKKVAAERILDEAKTAQDKGEETSEALIFDATSEFITSIQCNPTAVEFHAMAASPPVKRRPHDISMIPAGTPAEEIVVGEIVVEMDEDEDSSKLVRNLIRR